MCPGISGLMVCNLSPARDQLSQAHGLESFWCMLAENWDIMYRDDYGRSVACFVLSRYF